MPNNAPFEWLELPLMLPNGQVEPIILDYRRAVFLLGTKTLLISDLHWGKAETFRQHGIPIPQQVFDADLQRLSTLIEHYSPSRILILGDLIHGKSGLTEGLFQTVQNWREQHQTPIMLIAGNHDRYVQALADACGIHTRYEPLMENGFLFSHHPLEGSGLYTWCGHIHPAVRLASATDSIRLPCFHLTPKQGTLPAFSYFTGGYNIQRQSSDQIVAIIPDGLFIV